MEAGNTKQRKSEGPLWRRLTLPTLLTIAMGSMIAHSPSSFGAPQRSAARTVRMVAGKPMRLRYLALPHDGVKAAAEITAKRS